jgi:hypothetical protein
LNEHFIRTKQLRQCTTGLPRKPESTNRSRSIDPATTQRTTTQYHQPHINTEHNKGNMVAVATVVAAAATVGDDDNNKQRKS